LARRLAAHRRVETALRELGLHQENPEGVLVDFVADFLHYCRAEGMPLSLHELIKSAVDGHSHFVTEIAQTPESDVDPI